MKPIYLDYNATTPIDKEVADAMLPYLYSNFGNPSSTHVYGVETKKAIEQARRSVAELIRCKPYEIIFTSGGTESNNYAIKGIALANKHKGNHIITSRIEHPAVIEVCKYLQKNGFDVTYLPVDEYGMVSPINVENAITSKTILITIMHANNEVGTIQPIEEIGVIAKKRVIAFHSDAAQSLGKIPVDVNTMNLSLLSIAGHKLYAPKGVGAIYIKNGIGLEKLIHGADHEMNCRAGTENVLEIVGLGKACELAKRDLLKNSKHLKSMRDLLFGSIIEKLQDVKLNGHPVHRLPNTLSLSFKNAEANHLLASMPKIAASAGAACHTGAVKVSSVLEAMKVPLEFARGTIRFSTGKFTTAEDVKTSASCIIRAIYPSNDMGND
jgi:cysteine desulfurase NifS